MNSLVSSKWLNDHLLDSDLIIFDASTSKTGAQLENWLDDVFIKGARRINKDDFIDKESPLPNTILDAGLFEIAARKLGVFKNSKIVIYDNKGIYSSPRVWWMFKLMGHTDVYVLDGGLPDWSLNGYPRVDHLLTMSTMGDFEAKYQPNMYRSLSEVQANLHTKKDIICDARSSDRFYGNAPEPRPNLKSGHIPDSRNIHFASVLDNGKMKSNESLKSIFSGLENKPLVFSCGSGTSACILMLAADQVLDSPLAIYDGSWSEWGSQNDCPLG